MSGSLRPAPDHRGIPESLAGPFVESARRTCSGRRFQVSQAILFTSLLFSCRSVVVLPTPADEDGAGGERHYVLSRFGVRCGRLEERVEVRAGKDCDREIVTVRTFRSWAGRPDGSGGETVETWVETGSGAPLAISIRSTGLDGDILAEGTAGEKKLTFRIRSSGRDYLLEISCDPPPLFPRAIEKLVRERGFDKGTVYSYRTYSPDIGSVVTATHEVLGRRQIRLAGRTVGANAVRRTGGLSGAAETLFYDDVGRLLRADSPMMDSVIEMAAWEEAARPMSEREIRAARAAADAASAVPLSPARFLLPPPGRTEHVVYLISVRGGETFPFDPAVLDHPPRQVLERRDGRSIWLRVRRAATPDDSGDGAGREPLSEEDVNAAFLAPGPLAQSDDPGIRAKALELAAGENDLWRIARKIEAYVARAVADSPAPAHLSSAKQVHENPAGACTEMAVYFVALARAAGIPARAVLGLAQADHGAFRYHMWAQVRIGGRWVDMDPTRPGEIVGATHIALAGSSLSGMGLGTAGMICAAAMGKLEISIGEVAAGGKTYTPVEAMRAWSMDGGRFEDRYFGLSIVVPEGWEVAPRGRLTKDGMPPEGIVLSVKKPGAASGTLTLEFAGSRRGWESEADIRASLPEGMREAAALERIEISGRPAALAVRRGVLPDNARVAVILPFGRVRYNMDIRVRSAGALEEAIGIARRMDVSAGLIRPGISAPAPGPRESSGRR
ncbi:MAG: transglutaminase domain-containing protein [Planctomycetota bacterium]|nr:transglutaminase domain-containing protein [Planctomycetota bacterium]